MIKMNNSPIFVISGTERRQIKKRLGKLKRFIKMYWHYQDIDEVYGGNIHTKKESLIFLAKKQTELNELISKLSQRL